MYVKVQNATQAPYSTQYTSRSLEERWADARVLVCTGVTFGSPAQLLVTTQLLSIQWVGL